MRKAMMVAMVGVGSVGALSQYDPDFGFATVDPVEAHGAWHKTLGEAARERPARPDGPGDDCALDKRKCDRRTAALHHRLRFDLDDIEVARPLGLGAVVAAVLARRWSKFYLSARLRGGGRGFGLRTARASYDEVPQGGLGVQGIAFVVPCVEVELSHGAVACYELEVTRWHGTPAEASFGRAVLWSTSKGRLDVSIDGFAIYEEGATLNGIRDPDWRDRFSALVAPPMIDRDGDGDGDAWRIVGRARGSLAERRRPIDSVRAGWLHRSGDSNVTTWTWKADGDQPWWVDRPTCWPSPPRPDGRSTDEVLCRTWVR